MWEIQGEKGSKKWRVDGRGRHGRRWVPWSRSDRFDRSMDEYQPWTGTVGHFVFTFSVALPCATQDLFFVGNAFIHLQHHIQGQHATHFNRTFLLSLAPFFIKPFIWLSPVDMHTNTHSTQTNTWWIGFNWSYQCGVGWDFDSCCRTGNTKQEGVNKEGGTMNMRPLGGIVWPLDKHTHIHYSYTHSTSTREARWWWYVLINPIPG